jgi:hypothetical protein
MGHEYSLDVWNFFLANVRQGLGPYLAIFLVSYARVAARRLGASVLALPRRPAGLEIDNNTKDRGTLRIQARSSHSDDN